MENYSKVAKSLAGEFEYLCCAVEEKLATRCESPIELMLGTAMVVGWNISSGFGDTLFIAVANDEFAQNSALVLRPQYAWESYRIDFAILTSEGGIVAFVECDGHEFHERTKEQAERDRSKDRKIQEAGVPILRFTGREIFRDPGGCAGQILTFIQKHISRRAHGTHPNDKA